MIHADGHMFNLCGKCGAAGSSQCSGFCATFHGDAHLASDGMHFDGDVKINPRSATSPAMCRRSVDS